MVFFDTRQLMRWCCVPFVRSRCTRTIVRWSTYMVLLEELMRSTGVDWGSPSVNPMGVRPM